MTTDRIEQIKTLEVQLKEKCVNVVEIAAKMGMLLSQEREICAKGEFKEWIEVYFEFSPAWAYRCIRIAKHWEEISTRVEFLQKPTLQVAYEVSGELECKENSKKEPTEGYLAKEVPLKMRAAYYSMSKVDQQKYKEVERLSKHVNSMYKIISMDLIVPSGYPEDIQKDVDQKIKGITTQLINALKLYTQHLHLELEEVA